MAETCYADQAICYLSEAIYYAYLETMFLTQVNWIKICED